VQQMNQEMPAVVPLPGEIDLNNAEEVSDRISAALEPGVTAVIADLSATTFCDSSGLRHLLLAHERASANGTNLRFAVPADCPVRRILTLTGADRVLDIYLSLEEARAGGPPQGRPAPRKGATKEPPAHPMAT
jgi:anti-sigma B factor antagonist